ncbi:MAG TPA: HlyC/CorC family transporter [Xanthobacteraceae bacterium]|jgi:Mg2+/Co2+ transporter CorB|nr:HlyC/CorC family transporter [Xanthobacteraceae bacterium]
MTTPEIAVLAAIVLCFAAAFYCTLSETALANASRTRMTALDDGGDPRAHRVNLLLQSRERVSLALLLANGTAVIAASVLAAIWLLSRFGAPGILYAFATVTLGAAILALALPRAIALLHPDRTALVVARTVAALMKIFGPFAAACEALVCGIVHVLRIKPSTEHHSGSEELRGAVDLLHSEGEVVKDDRDMLDGLLDLRELEVSDVMVHRTKMAAINADDPPEKIVGEVLASSYTRLPLWRGTAENIVGVLHAKDLLRELNAVGGDESKIDVDAIALEPWFVPNTTTLDAQLKAFRKRKTHFALVVDEYGEVMGLVTLEDIIEEIVGDIADEHDLPISGLRPQADGSVSVDGAMPIRDLNRAMDWHLPDEQATTVAGLVIHEARLIPDAGQIFTFHGFRFQVLRRNRNRITAMKVMPLKEPVREEQRSERAA